MTAPIFSMDLDMSGLAVLAAQQITLDTSDPLLYYKRIDRLRMGFFSTIGKLWRADFNKENRDLLGAVAGFDTPIGWRNAIEAEVTRHYDMGSTYERTYGTVFPIFAERVYDALVGKGKSAGRGFEQKADPKLVDAWLKAAIEFIQGEGGELITAVGTISHKLVVKWAKILTEKAVLEGWSINRLKVELSSKLTGIAEYRARRIARTEVMRSANLGSRAAAKTTGLDIIKEWLIGPKGTGDRHATKDYPGLAGQKRKLDELYSVGGHPAMYPLDIRLPPEESINCRCSESYMPK